MTTKDIPLMVHFNLMQSKDIVQGYLPEQSEDYATGFDVRNAGPKITLFPFQKAKIHLGFRAIIPDGWWFELRPRSSTFGKKDLVSLYGVIDQNYTGEWLFATQYIPDMQNIPEFNERDFPIFDVRDFLNYLPDCSLTIEHGEKIAQIILYPRYSFSSSEVSDEEFMDLDNKRDNKRGAGGFGSTG